MCHTCASQLTQILHFFTPSLELCSKFKYLLTMHWSYIMYIIHSCFLSYKWITFVEDVFSNFVIFRIKCKFEPKVFNICCKIEFRQFQFLFSLLIIKLIFFSNLKKNGAHLGKKIHFKILNVLWLLKHHQFASKFEHWN
jgi:hypothetical protein